MNANDLPATPQSHAPSEREQPLRLGFARGISPSKWQRRWRIAVPERRLELVALDLAFGPEEGARGLPEEVDVLLERAMPGARPGGAEPAGSAQAGLAPKGSTPAGSAQAGSARAGSARAGSAQAGSARAGSERHAVRLYTEAVALVVAADHELAGEASIDEADLALVPLLDHPAHAPEWPAPDPWRDPSWAPADATAALELVATGAGAILLPLPLARHLAAKRAHAVLPVRGELAGTAIWATWDVARDGSDVQQLLGVMRGRTARSGRKAQPDAEPAKGRAPRQAKTPKKAALKPNSRGAQLAAAKEKAERLKAERRRARKRR